MRCVCLLFVSLLILTFVLSGSAKALPSLIPTVTIPGPTIVIPGPTVTIPGPIVKVPGPTVAAAPRTVIRSGPTVTAPARTVTATPTPGASSTSTVTLGSPRNTPTGQVPGGSARVTHAPPPKTFHLISKKPATAAAEGALFGLVLGIVLGLIGLFVVYRLGRKAGERATLQEFLDDIRGKPASTRGRHRN